MNASQELTITRDMPAPPERVFAAWTTPRGITAWMGPPGVTVTDPIIDARPGGGFRFELRAPNGEAHIAVGQYREVSPPNRLVFTWSWEGKEPPFCDEMLITLTFAAHSDGATRMTLHQAQIGSTEARDAHQRGWDGSLTCLAEYLSEGAPAS